MRLKLFVWILLWGYSHLSSGSTSTVDNEKEALLLNQPWKLVLNEFLTFEEVTSDTTAVDVNVPGTWNGTMWKGEMFSGQGYGTYYIKLDLTEHTALRNSPLVLEMADVGLAYRVYANARFLGEVGQVGTSKEEAKPKLKTEVFYLPEVDTDQLYIIVHISNYWHQSGGIWFAPRIGLIPTATASRNRHNN